MKDIRLKDTYTCINDTIFNGGIKGRTYKVTGLSSTNDNVELGSCIITTKQDIRDNWKREE